MPRIYLVRHGRAAATWDKAADPGLDDLGRAQAREVAQALSARLKPTAIVSSPMARARETAEPLARIWGRDVEIEQGVSEITTPDARRGDRGAWLKEFSAGVWGDAEPAQQCWRANTVRALLDLQQDAVVFTHFMVINAAVAQARGNDRVIHFVPANGSVTVMETVMDELRLVELGQEDDATKVG